MKILRDHGPQASSPQKLRQGLLGADICMHAGYGPVRNSQTTGSMVSHLKHGSQTHWLTGTAAPCTSLFKPVWIDSGLPETGLSPKGTYDHASLWWRHEAFHREVIRDYATRISIFQHERDEMEESFSRGCQQVADRGHSERALFSKRCFSQSEEATQGWYEQVCTTETHSRPGRLYQAAWNGFNKQASLPGRVKEP
jgi:secernin